MTLELKLQTEDVYFCHLGHPMVDFSRRFFLERYAQMITAEIFYIFPVLVSVVCVFKI